MLGRAVAPEEECAADRALAQSSLVMELQIGSKTSSVEQNY